MVTYPFLQNVYCWLVVFAEVFATVMHYAAVVVRGSKRINGPSVISSKIIPLT